MGYIQYELTTRAPRPLGAYIERNTCAPVHTVLDFDEIVDDFASRKARKLLI